ncbi:flavin-binding monooxygenase-like protein [Metarhizium robertsii]|uniref:Flavin monooxygenase-like protein n=2 Tax=Metarhizium robertsii TaxID=568076 RepID=E9EMV5_METRA|nr:Flavin monooxygenase-like protein [Metarhizium robertsii ARSEF 23]EFZ03299.1 Flavin monooxygenase-like protein [Metarhizium robertsii ARSEF 23]EXU94651.1 flavin-binding monooxygenase-like protein [Metarhizium robertsii]
MKNGNGEGYDVLVVSGGIYRLIAAYTYPKLAPETNLLILDDGRSAGSGAPSASTQTFLRRSATKTGLSPDWYISSQTIHNYLQSFAEDHDLVRRIRLPQKVAKANKIGGKWVLTLNDGASQASGAKLIVATGVTSGPYVPEFPQKAFHKPILHSSELGKYISSLIGPNIQRVTVLGAAKSAYDTAFMLIKFGKQVDWINRENGSGVRKEPVKFDQ